MKKIQRNIMIIFIIITILMLSLTTLVNASGSMGLDDLQGGTIQEEELSNIGNSIIGFATNIGVVLSVVVIGLLGIKYMLGSVEERAEYKRTLLPYLIGAMLVFAASIIANIIYNFII